MIKSSELEVSEGVKLIAQTQAALDGITQSTTVLSEKMASIATATNEQSSAIMQVRQVVGDMDRITQQNAALVEESTAASQELSNSALNLLQLVARFDLGNSRAASSNVYPVRYAA